MFDFIQSPILKQNINRTLTHILDLLVVLNGEEVSQVAKSSYRKTIIIHTASIVEAMLFDFMEQNLMDQDYVEREKKYRNIKIIHTISVDKRIVAGTEQIIKKKLQKDKLNLAQIVKLLRGKDLIDSDVRKKVDTLRLLRNDQHLSTQGSCKEYSDKELDKALSTMFEVQEFIEKKTK